MDESKSLRDELAQMRILCNDILHSESVTFDERRVNLLKAQMYQLERQVLLLSDALGSRTSVLQEFVNALVSVCNTCREYIKAEVSGPEVPVKRSDLTGIVQKLEACRVRLSKGTENKTWENLQKPLMFMNSYIKDGAQEQTTLFDICSGELQHLNLKRVYMTCCGGQAQLESRLCRLYSNLQTLHDSIQVYQDKDSDAANFLLFHKNTSLKIHTDRFNTHLQLSCAMLKDCCEELLPLSLLYPAAPWNVLKKPILSDLTTERVVSALPTMPRPKHSAVARVIDDLMKVTNHRLYINKRQIEMLKNELRYHQSVYSLQHQYIESLFTAVSEGYTDFEKNLSAVIHQPIKELVDAFESLQSTASDTNMRRLLEMFHTHHAQSCMLVDDDHFIVLLTTTFANPCAIYTLQVADADDGSKIQLRAIRDDLTTSKDASLGELSQFATRFRDSLDRQCQRCKKTKNKETKEIEALLDDQAHLESQLRDTLAEYDAKKACGEKVSSSDVDDGNLSVKRPDVESCSVRNQDRVRKPKTSMHKGTAAGYRGNRSHALRRDSSSGGLDMDRFSTENKGLAGRMAERVENMSGSGVLSEEPVAKSGVKRITGKTPFR